MNDRKMSKLQSLLSASDYVASRSHKLNSYVPYKKSLCEARVEKNLIDSNRRYGTRCAWWLLKDGDYFQVPISASKHHLLNECRSHSISFGVYPTIGGAHHNCNIKDRVINDHRNRIGIKLNTFQ